MKKKITAGILACVASATVLAQTAPALAEPGEIETLITDLLTESSSPADATPADSSLGGAGSSDGGTGIIPTTGSEYMTEADKEWSDAVSSYGPEFSDVLKQPVAFWGMEKRDGQMKQILARAKRDKTVPIIVLYDIPNRDLGSHSGGGQPNINAWTNWVKKVSNEIGDTQTAVIMEPDALAHIEGKGGTDRIEGMAEALKILDSNKNTMVYVDIGHPDFRANGKAKELQEAAKKKGTTIEGLAVNVSNFYGTERSANYGKEVSRQIGIEPRIMVDVARNGADKMPSGWCNPAGQKLGKTNDRIFDPNNDVEQAFIKVPGQSDGNCGIAPNVPAGQTNKEYLKSQMNGWKP